MKSAEEASVCRLCFNSLSEVKLPCSHSFCSKCLAKWSGGMCPLCTRYDVVGHGKSVETNANVCRNTKISLMQNELKANIESLSCLEKTMKLNMESLNVAEMEIQRRYDFHLSLLNKEKESALNSLGKLMEENKTYSSLQMLLNQTLVNVKLLSQETNECSEAKHQRVVDEFNDSEIGYCDFKSRSLRLFGGMQEKPNSYFGEVLTNEMNVAEILPKRATVRDIPFENLKLTTAKPAENCRSESLISRFSKCSSSTPRFEASISHKPSHMTSYGNLVFVTNDYDTLSVFEICDETFHAKRPNQKLSITNIRSVGVNSRYFGVLYSDLTKDEVKRFRKNMHPSGVALFTRSEHIVSPHLYHCVSHKSNFECPSGMVLTDDHIYICGKKLGKIYKLDFEGKSLQKVEVSDKVNDLSLNSKFLVYTDYTTHELNLLDLAGLKFIKKTKILQENEFIDGPLSVELVSDSMVFIVNETRWHVSLYDINLNFIAKFTAESCDIFQMTTVNTQANNCLVLGCRTKDNDYKLCCFSA